MASLHRVFGLSRLALRVGARRCRFHREMSTSDELDKPVKYSSSGAASWKAAYTRSGSDGEDDSLWCEQPIVILSCAAFLIYFCVLREENDIDELIDKPLSDHIEGLEEVQLRVALQYNLDKGLPTADIANRLKEIEAEKALKSQLQ